MQLEARIPVRIDFGGPWTDTPEFYESEAAERTCHTYRTVDGIRW